MRLRTPDLVTVATGVAEFPVSQSNCLNTCTTRETTTQILPVSLGTWNLEIVLNVQDPTSIGLPYTCLRVWITTMVEERSHTTHICRSAQFVPQIVIKVRVPAN